MRLLALFTFLFSFLAPMTPAAYSQEDPRVVMEAFLEELRTFWVPLNSDPQAPYDSRRLWTQDLVRNRFDFAHMTRSSMGTRWNQMTEEQQETYELLFFDAWLKPPLIGLMGMRGKCLNSPQYPRGWTQYGNPHTVFRPQWPRFKRHLDHATNRR